MPIRIVITERIQAKLAEKHKVTRAEIEECFLNREGGLLLDEREDHKTDPPTLWFISETDAGRTLKIVFVERDGIVFLKTAYDANEDEKRIYEQKAK